MHPSRFLHLSAEQLQARATAVTQHLANQSNARLKAWAGHVDAALLQLVEATTRARTATTAQRNARALREDAQDSILQMVRALARDAAESAAGITLDADGVLTSSLPGFSAAVEAFLQHVAAFPEPAATTPVTARLEQWNKAYAQEQQADEAWHLAQQALLTADVELRARMRALAYVVRDEISDADAIQAVFDLPQA